MDEVRTGPGAKPMSENRPEWFQRMRGVFERLPGASADLACAPKDRAELSFHNPHTWVEDNGRLMMSLPWTQISGGTVSDVEAAAGVRVTFKTQDGGFELGFRYLGMVRGEVLFEATAEVKAQTKGQLWPTVELLTTWHQPALSEAPR